MPIRQPIQSIIYADDFRDKTYCFTVESVLMHQERTGMLTVSASAGYLITTSFTKNPGREHTFQHHQQADNSWLAKGDVTLIATGDSPIDGTITIRNAQGEMLVLTIDAASTPGVQAHEPVLNISEPLPVFARTVAGKPSYLVLTLAQQYTNAPVTVTTDSPDYFLLASDSRPTFLPALTLIPSATGTHVHVRYVAQKNGVHTGHLIIEAKYETKTIPLKGRSASLLPALRKPSLPAHSAMLPPSSQQIPGKVVPSKRWLSALALVVVTGLTYAGYTRRCQLFPSLCVDAPVTQTSSFDSKPVVTDKSAEKLTENKTIPKRVTSNELPTPALRVSQTNSPATQSLPVESAKEQLADGQRIDRKPTPSRQFNQQEADVQSDKVKTRPKPPVATAEESDLERALNQPL